MPELPEVDAVRRRIAPSMVGARIKAVDLRRPDLRRPFPRNFVKRLTGQTVLALTRRAKYLLASLSSGETLLMHLGMSGSFRVMRKVSATRRAKSAGDPHDHVVFHMSSGNTIVFNDPRRFGLMDLFRSDRLQDHPVLSGLGLEPLSEDFTPSALARACRGKKTSLKAALLDQRVVAGLGNIYANEALHVAGLSPRRQASVLSTPSGAPRVSAHRLTAAIKQVLEKARARRSKGSYRGSPFLVYERQDEACLKKHCSGTIHRCVQGGRSTFFCPACQR